MNHKIWTAGLPLSGEPAVQSANIDSQAAYSQRYSMLKGRHLRGDILRRRHAICFGATGDFIPRAGCDFKEGRSIWIECRIIRSEDTVENRGRRGQVPFGREGLSATFFLISLYLWLSRRDGSRDGILRGIVSGTMLAPGS